MRRLAISLLVPLAVAVASPAPAQEQPPARVGRVSYVQGQLAFHTKGEKTWSSAAVNYPVATGGSFWTDPKSRAEMRIGPQTIDLAGNTEIDVVKLDQQVMQLAMPQGRIELHLRSLPQGNSVEIDIPRGGAWLLQPGVYDIDAGNPSQPARVAVFEGRARFVGGSVDIGVTAGQAAVISGTQTLTASLEKVAPDEFAQWCRGRDYHQNRLASPYYVSPQMTGYEELDEYGSWRTVPEYGRVWYPGGVPVGWVPYSDGYWMWEEPWGWNWIGLEPWGFAPFHYGRWAFIGGAWGWVPGAFVPYPIYAPALVAFVADPTVILAAAVAGPVVGWFPLAPGEAFWPSYTSDPVYIRAVNTGVVADPAHLGPRPTGDPATANLAFANRGAATVVRQQTFASAQRVASAALRVSQPAAAHARVTAQAPSARPALARGGAGGAGTRIAGPSATGHLAGAASASAAHGGGHGGAPLATSQQAATAAATAHGAAARGGARVSGGGTRHFAGARGGGRGAPHLAARQFAAPRMARGGRGASHFAGSRFGGGAHGGPHVAGSRFGGGPHFGGAPHFGGGMPHGGGPRLGAGGMAHFGGGPHGGGGGGPHGGGGGGPHGGGGGGGKGHG